MSFLLNLLPSRWGNKDPSKIDVTRIDPALRHDLSREVKQALEVGEASSEPSSTSYAYIMKQIEEEMEEARNNLKRAENAEVFVGVRLASYKKKIEKVMSKANAPAEATPIYADKDADKSDNARDPTESKEDIEHAPILKGNEVELLRQVEEKHLKLLENVIEMRRQVEALEERKTTIEKMRDEACQFADAVDDIDSNAPIMGEKSEPSIDAPENSNASTA